MILDIIVNIARNTVSGLGLEFVESSPGCEVTRSNTHNVSGGYGYYIAIVAKGGKRSSVTGSEYCSAIYFYSDNIIYCQPSPFKSTEISYADPECMNKLDGLLQKTHSVSVLARTDDHERITKRPGWAQRMRRLVCWIIGQE